MKPLAEQMSSQKEINELKELFTTKEKVFDKATQGVKQSLETVELNNQWRTTMYNDFQRRMNRMMTRNFDNNDIDADEEPFERSETAETEIDTTTMST